MQDLVAEAQGAVEELKQLGDKIVETVAGTVASNEAAPVSNVVAATEPVAAPTSAAPSDDDVLSTMKVLFASDGSEPRAWDQLVALAKVKAQGAGLVATVGKLKILLPISGTTVVGFDETFAAALALNVG